MKHEPHLHRHLALAVGLYLFATCMLVAEPTCRAAEPLRWKLESGAELDYEITKSTTLSLGEPASVYRLRQQLSATWRVVEVSAEGNATIEQTVHRVRLALDDPLGKVDYDSDVDDEPGSLAALAAPMFDALLDETVRFTLSPHGEMGNVTIPEPLLDAVTGTPLAKSLGSFASPEGIRSLVVPQLPTFPERDIEPGDKWSNATDSAGGLSSWQKFEIAYRFTGDEPRDGNSLAVISIEPKLAFTPAENAPVEFKSQQSSGELLFDRTRGRIQSSHWQVQLEIAAGDAEHGTLEQEFRMEAAADGNSE